MIKVFIIDDHLIVREGLRLILETNEAYTIIGEAENGQQALVLLETLSPYVILLDINMPILDGLNVLKKLKQIGNTIPVIVLTVSKGKRDMFVNGYGFNEYMEKLLTQDKVMETLPKLFKDLEFTKIESNKSA